MQHRFQTSVSAKSFVSVRTAAAGICVTLLVAFGAARAQDNAAPAAPAAPATAAPPVAGADPLVEQGRYLAAAGDCVSCHTRADAEPFSGGLPMKTPFGTIYSANITPDPNTGIGNWTEEQFARAMREGIAANGEHLYPAFPYTAYSKVTDQDVKAIYAYLKSLKPVAYTPPKNEMPFPFSMRSLMAIWNKLFFQPGPYVANASQSADWNRGAYLVQGLGHCGACHSPRNALGAERESLAMTGGTVQEAVLDEVTEDKIVKQDPPLIRPWSAANLTTASDGLGAWSLDEIATYLKTGHTARAGAFWPMSEVIANSTQHLTDQDLHAMAAYLKALPSATQNSGQAIAADKVSAGEVVYTVRCGDCHLPTGLGLISGDPSKMAPPLVGNPIVQAPDPATLINVILYGAHETAGREGAWPNMTGFEAAIGLDDTQIANLANYLRSSWGNKGDTVDAGAVAKQR